MDDSTGKLAFIFLVAVVVTVVAAALVKVRYRRAMGELMRAPLSVALPVTPPASASTLANGAATSRSAPRVVTAAENHLAAVRLSALIVGLSLLVSASAATLQVTSMFPDEPFSVPRASVLTLIHLWPFIPALGMVWRWSGLRILGALAGWCVLCFAVALWRSITPMPLQILLFLAIEIGPALVVIAGICLLPSTRAIAPWLLPPVLGFVWVSMTGLDLLGWLVTQRSAFLSALPAWLPVHVVFVLFAVLPWLLAWWPLKAFAHLLARAYVRKDLSELGVLFTAVWAISLFHQSLGSASNRGVIGAVMLLPLGWIVLAFVVARGRRSTAAGRPPTLLVLRVFQHDQDVQRLFDAVIERWRLTGNTVLIAGTDLVDRTIDADEVFAFLDRRLAARFIGSPADVERRLADFDLQRDDDGRYRVNECYCHDTAWKAALAALVERSDVVLMDLRGFQAHNAGCVHELSALARASALQRVVVLVDGATDRVAADAAAQGAPADRFVHIDAGRLGTRALDKAVLASLFAPGPNAAAPQGRIEGLAR
ncbi:MAG: hypothetical protein ABIV63_09500 [Caldimonas sp.]